MKHNASPPTNAKPRLRQWLFLAVSIIGLYVIVPQLGTFKHSLHLLNAIDWYYAGLAFTAVVTSYLAAASSYYFLSFKPLKYNRTVLVELGSMFANRLLPAGIGGISANFSYLRRSGHSGTQAASVVAINNVLGLLGHGLLLVLVIGLLGVQAPTIHNSHLDTKTVTVSVIIAGLIIFGLLSRPIIGQRVRAALQAFIKQLINFRQRPTALLAALLSSMLLTVATVLSLWLSVYALHLQVPFTAVFIIFSLGIAIGTATPTPGGLGGIEAGLVAGFIAYHVPSDQALAIVLLYRLISYWLPLLIGGTAFVICQRRQYF